MRIDSGEVLIITLSYYSGFYEGKKPAQVEIYSKNVKELARMYTKTSHGKILISAASRFSPKKNCMV